jgi:thioredoxin-dependent peroxiredoxin
MVKEGKKAPAFCLKDAKENKVCLKDFAGSWVALYFYPKDNTPGCTIEAKDFTKELDGFEKLGARVLGVSADSCESHRRFIAKQGLEITLLSDESKKTLKKYGVWRKKSFMGKEFMGIVRTTVLIDPKGKIAKVWSPVSVAGHVKEVKNEISKNK